MKYILSALYFFATYSLGFAQLTITPNPDTNQIRNQLQGSGVQIYNLQLYADTISYGLFQGNSELPINSGFAITTGDVNEMSGHVDSVFADSALYHDALGWSETSDVDPNAIYDYNRLSFSIIPVGDTLKLGYCFASEDYMRMYNDVGAIMISGPNPAGGQYDSIRLSWIANSGSPACVWNCNMMVWQPFFNEYHYMPALYESYYGGTIYLERKIAVVPGQPYYISLSVADATDRNYDSALLVEGLWSDSTLGVPDLSGSVLDLYPNPSTATTIFKFSDNLQREVIITDQFGREVWRKESSESVIEFPANEFSAGLYFYTIFNSGSRSSSGKFIIEH